MPDRPDLPEPFRVDVERVDGAVRVRPKGELDLASVDDLDARLRAECAAGRRRLVLDLSELRFMDSTGLRLMLTWDARARSDGIEFVVTTPPEHVERVIVLAGVRERLRFE